MCVEDRYKIYRVSRVGWERVCRAFFVLEEMPMIGDCSHRHFGHVALLRVRLKDLLRWGSVADYAT